MCIERQDSADGKPDDTEPSNLVQHRMIGFIYRLLAGPPSDSPGNADGTELNALNEIASEGALLYRAAFQPALLNSAPQLGHENVVPNAYSSWIEGRVVEDNLASAMGAGEDLRPDCVVNVSLEGLPVGRSDGGLVHPAVLIFESAEQSLRGFIEVLGVDREVHARLQ